MHMLPSVEESLYYSAPTENKPRIEETTGYVCRYYSGLCNCVALCVHIKPKSIVSLTVCNPNIVFYSSSTLYELKT